MSHLNHELARQTRRVLDRVRSERDEAQALVDKLRVDLDAPSRDEGVTLLTMMRDQGATAFWENATVAERRTLIRILIERLDLQRPAGRKRYSGLAVTWRQWLYDNGMFQKKRLR